MMPPKMPQGWEQWVLTDMLGEGSFGAVYRAEKAIGGKKIESAVKIIRIPASESKEKEQVASLGSEAAAQCYFRAIADECMTEISAMSAMKSVANIVNIEDFMLAPAETGIGFLVFIRMELLTGFNEYARQHPMEEADVIRLGMDLARALEYCEKKNILHRDIKLSNIFVSPSGDFKLGDFGVSRSLGVSLESYTKVGSPAYMAPEIGKNEYYDHRVDIYSLGLVLYQLMNRNRAPFLDPGQQFLSTASREEARKRRLNGEPLPPPGEASPAFARVILKACAYNPDDRYADASQFRKALQALPGRSGGSAEPSRTESPVPGQVPPDQPAVPAQPALRAPRKRSRAPFLILPAVILLLLLGFLIRTDRNGRSVPLIQALFSSGDEKSAADPSGTTVPSDNVTGTPALSDPSATPVPTPEATLDPTTPEPTPEATSIPATPEPTPEATPVPATPAVSVSPGDTVSSGSRLTGKTVSKGLTFWVDQEEAGSLIIHWRNDGADRYQAGWVDPGSITVTTASGTEYTMKLQPAIWDPAASFPAGSEGAIIFDTPISQMEGSVSSVSIFGVLKLVNGLPDWQSQQTVIIDISRDAALSVSSPDTSSTAASGSLSGETAFQTVVFRIDQANRGTIRIAWENTGSADCRIGWVGTGRIDIATDAGKTYMMSLPDYTLGAYSSGAISFDTPVENMEGRVSVIMINNVMKMNTRGLPDYFSGGSPVIQVNWTADP